MELSKEDAGRGVGQAGAGFELKTHSAERYMNRKNPL